MDDKALGAGTDPGQGIAGYHRVCTIENHLDRSRTATSQIGLEARWDNHYGTHLATEKPAIYLAVARYVACQGDVLFTEEATHVPPGQLAPVLIEHSVRDLLDVKGQDISESEKEKSRGKGDQKQGTVVADDVQTFFAHDGQGSM